MSVPFGSNVLTLSAVAKQLRTTFILLAYGLYMLLEWMDDKYPLLRQKLPSRQRLFNDIHALTTYLCSDSWDALLVFMLSGFSHPPPLPNPRPGRAPPK